MTVAVLFGGKSCEHNVSIVTGVMALQACGAYKAVPVYIDERGVWRTGSAYADIQTFRDKKARTAGKEVHLRPSSPYLYYKSGKKACKLDACLICNHGINGEDGSLQGLLQLSGIPYTGSGVAASAAGLNKILMKKLFVAEKLPVVPYVTADSEQYVNDSLRVLETIKKELKFPLIVKPCRTGSSIGIGIAHDYSELFAALRTAFQWDTQAVVEQALCNFEEYNCAVLCGEPSEVEKPVGWKEFLTYEDKYLSKSDSVGREFPAAIDDALRDRIRTLAVSAYRAVGAQGAARVDFLYKDGDLYVNEINTVPGSLAAYFFEGGMEYVVQKQLDEAFAWHARRDRLQYAYKPFGGEQGKK